MLNPQEINELRQILKNARKALNGLDATLYASANISLTKAILELQDFIKQKSLVSEALESFGTTAATSETNSADNDNNYDDLFAAPDSELESGVVVETNSGGDANDIF